MSSSHSRLNPEEFKVLEEEHIIRASVNSNGKIKVSTGLLRPKASGDITTSSNSASGASVQVQYKDQSSIRDFELPENLESVTLLEFLGYTRMKAEEIFMKWTTRPDPDSNPHSLKNYAMTELNNFEPAPIQESLHQSAEAMRRFGISQELIERMIAREHQDLFVGQTLCFWLEIAMRSRYGTAHYYLENLKNRAIEILHAKEKMCGKIEGDFQPASTFEMVLRGLPYRSRENALGSRGGL